MWIACPAATSAASRTPSLSVGCAWIVASISSQVASSVIASPEFRDHFRRLGADDVRAEDFAVRFADDELHKAFALANRTRFAEGHERKLSRP
jgi:hypothetical protein